MNETQLKLNPETLAQIIAAMKKYTERQKQTLEGLTASIKSLNDEWNDAPGYGEMLSYIESTDKKAVAELEEISKQFCSYYNEKIVSIRTLLNSLKI